MAKEELNFCIGTITGKPDAEKGRPCHHRNYTEECRLCFIRRQHEYRRIKGMCKCALPRIVEEDTNGNVESIRSGNARRACCVRKVIRSQILDSLRRTNTALASEPLDEKEKNTAQRPKCLSMSSFGRMMYRMDMHRQEARMKRRLALQTHRLAQDLEGLSVSSNNTKPADLSEQFTRLSVDNKPEAASSSSSFTSDSFVSGSSLLQSPQAFSPLPPTLPGTSRPSMWNMDSLRAFEKQMYYDRALLLQVPSVATPLLPTLPGTSQPVPWTDLAAIRTAERRKYLDRVREVQGQKLAALHKKALAMMVKMGERVVEENTLPDSSSLPASDSSDE